MTFTVEHQEGKNTFTSLEEALHYCSSKKDFCAIYDDETDRRVKAFNCDPEKIEKKLPKKWCFINDDKNITYYIREELKQIGAIWNNKVKKWKIVQEQYHIANNLLNSVKIITEEMALDDLIDNRQYWEEYFRTNNKKFIVVNAL